MHYPNRKMTSYQKNRQAQTLTFDEILGLPVLADRNTYTGRIKKNNPQQYMKAITTDVKLDTTYSILYPSTIFYNDDGSIVRDATGQFSINLSDIDNQSTFRSQVETAISSYATSQSYSVSDIVTAVDLQGVVAAPTSYQTIVSQTGTAVPAVSGGFTPANTYSGTTFTWARTGVGVYTLTASSAVFNTSKTGVFVAPLQNLNGSVRAVVTSSTVITVTTAVQSLAVLGLLGFTATNTDALLNGTMIYVQTYA